MTEIANGLLLQHLNVNKTFNIDMSKVGKFEFDPNVTVPAEDALADRQEFYVKDIHGIRGNPKRRSTLLFLVEWEGYEDRTWEPWSHLRHNSVLKQFLSAAERRDLRALAKGMKIPQRKSDLMEEPPPPSQGGSPAHLFLFSLLV